jgi:transport and Golgi organization protein 2
MCSLSVIPRDNGYLVGMNRGEQIARGAGLPPEVRESCGAKVIYPGGGEGGTWIGANEYAIALAVLNWNDVVPRSATIKKKPSRGGLIPALIASRSMAEQRAALCALSLRGMLPFRLVAVSPSEKQVGEWRWNLAHTEFLPHEWEVRHWFSSGLSDAQAEIVRGSACRDAWKQPDAGSVP